jgi:RNA polymerase sigma-70 factor (ECF subfamily)
MDDLPAIHRLQNGDIGGLETLVARYQLKAVRIAALITFDQALAEEVVQETFVRLHQRIRQFDDTRPFEPYLLRSVVNAALNAARHEHRSLSVSLDGDAAAVEAMLDQAPPVEAQVEFSQMKRAISQALSRLSPRQRAVIVQRYYLEMSEQEMSRASGAAPGTIKWLLNAARLRLRGLLRSERSAR